MWYLFGTEAHQYASKMPSSVSNYWLAAGHAVDKDIGHEVINQANKLIFLVHGGDGGQSE